MSDRVFKFRTPTKCQNGHFRFLFYSIRDGRARQVVWGDKQPDCQCPTGDKGEGFAPCGPEQQWTGLLDSEDRELFEGDVIWHSRYGSAFEVIWIPDATGFFIRNTEGQTMALSKLCQPHLKIIGNVNEGPTSA